MRIRKINKTIGELIQGAEWLGEGASKETFGKGDIVYKVPRGRYLIEEGGFGFNLNYPSTMEEMNEFLREVDEYEFRLVWPLGQFAMEIIIWETLKEIEEEGYDISCFARIKDYYFDKNGVLVIEQERCDEEWVETWSEDFSKLEEEIDRLSPVLEEYGIKLRDIRSGNCGYINGKIKLFDFGLSSNTDIDYYGSYSDYGSSSSSYSY